MHKVLIFVTCALACIAIFSIIKYKQSKPTIPDTLILLNGTSSSGKSAILDVFRKIDPNFQIFKIDDYYPSELLGKAKEFGWQEIQGSPWMFLVNYVEQKTGHPNFDTQVRAYLFPEIQPMYYDIRHALKSGKDCIVDTVFEYDPEYQKFSEFFKEYDCLKVLVYCPLNVLIERVQKRNNSGIKEETRAAFLAFEQFPELFKLQEHEQEPIVDSVPSLQIKVALNNAIEELVAKNIPQKYMLPLEQFKQNFIQHFKLDELPEIKLVPRHHYDLILNSGTHTPEELAVLIQEHMR